MSKCWCFFDGCLNIFKLFSAFSTSKFWCWFAVESTSKCPLGKLHKANETQCYISCTIFFKLQWDFHYSLFYTEKMKSLFIFSVLQYHKNFYFINNFACSIDLSQLGTFLVKVCWYKTPKMVRPNWKLYLFVENYKIMNILGIYAFQTWVKNHNTCGKQEI